MVFQIKNNNTNGRGILQNKKKNEDYILITSNYNFS